MQGLAVERFRCVSARAKDNKGLTAILVSPDGLVAWLVESEPGLSAAEQSIERMVWEQGVALAVLSLAEA